MASLPSRLLVAADQRSLERLLCDTILIRRTAATIKVELPDDSTLGGTAAKYISEAIAHRLVAAELPAITPDDLVAALERNGVKRERSNELASQFQAERTVNVAHELPTDKHLADLVMGHVNGSPYISLNITPADAPPAAKPTPEPVDDGRPQYSNPAGQGRPPTEAQIRQAKADHAGAVAEFEAIRAGKSAADARSIAARAHDAYLAGADR
jgi:hypothetical protein